ncbi:MAG: sugar O-acetyltransferase [Muribaculaceae bacterium]|nr:sugar O-acetyltransferase [Muribaculaceae bacterium]
MEEIWRKMLGGELYDATHPLLIERLRRTRDLLWEFNAVRPSDEERMRDILRNLLGHTGRHFHFNQPFRCDYGENIRIGENFFANFNLTILDEAPVTIGDNVFIGPNVSIYTACHPLDAPTRNKAIEWAEPVTIGNNVWIGGSVTIVPGVTIGDDCVIAAGSVVTKDVEPGTLVAGNPARFKKRLTPGDTEPRGFATPQCAVPDEWHGRCDFGPLEQLGLDTIEDDDEACGFPGGAHGSGPYEQLGLDSCAD